MGPVLRVSKCRSRGLKPLLVGCGGDMSTSPGKLKQQSKGTGAQTEMKGKRKVGSVLVMTLVRASGNRLYNINFLSFISM